MKMKISILVVILAAGTLIIWFQFRADSVVGTWVLDQDKAAVEMANAARSDGAEVTPELIEAFRKRATMMACEYRFQSNGEVTIQFDTNIDSRGLETGTWQEQGNQIIASVKKVSGLGSGQYFDRILYREGAFLVIITPMNGVKWTLQRK